MFRLINVYEFDNVFAMLLIMPITFYLNPLLSIVKRDPPKRK